AVFRSNASMSLKSNLSEPGTAIFSQVAPPSTVRRHVPREPLAHAILLSTALIPRSRALTPLSCGVIEAALALNCPETKDGIINELRMKRDAKSTGKNRRGDAETRGHGESPRLRFSVSPRLFLCCEFIA